MLPICGLPSMISQINHRTPPVITIKDDELLINTCYAIQALFEGPFHLFTTLTRESTMRSATLLRRFFYIDDHNSESKKHMRDQFLSDTKVRGQVAIIVAIHTLRTLNVTIDNLEVIHTRIANFHQMYKANGIARLKDSSLMSRFFGFRDVGHVLEYYGLTLQIKKDDKTHAEFQQMERQFIAATKLDLYRDIAVGLSLCMLKTYCSYLEREQSPLTFSQDDLDKQIETVHSVEFAAYFATPIPLYLITAAEVSIFVIYSSCIMNSFLKHADDFVEYACSCGKIPYPTTVEKYRRYYKQYEAELKTQFNQ